MQARRERKTIQKYQHRETLRMHQECATIPTSADGEATEASDIAGLGWRLAPLVNGSSNTDGTDINSYRIQREPARKED